MDDSATAAPDVITIRPLSAPPDVSLRMPGSKSLTNRALLCAALAPGRSTLTGVLFADDTRAMLDAVTGLGARLSIDEPAGQVIVDGIDPRARTAAARIDARQSGTTSRFVLPVLALSPGRGVLDGGAQLRGRPFGPLIEALRRLGAQVEEQDRAGLLPVAVTGPMRGGKIDLPGHVSSQFVSGLLLAGPLMADGLQVELSTPLVSEPYLRMTEAVMAAFGVSVDGLRVSPGRYRPADYPIEPDASAASYFLGAAAITGGRVTVEGLGTASLQGDVRFADLLEQMGARVIRRPDSLTVVGGDLHGIDVDLAHVSDTAQTLAAVAVFADTPTRVRGIGFIRGKESDRIGALVTELRRAGVAAVEHVDGFTVPPGEPVPTRFQTYDDHRMAMSLSLIGLRAPGIQISDPGCVAKTYPGFFTDLARLR